MRLINTVSFQLKNHSVFADSRGTQLDALVNQSKLIFMKYATCVLYLILYVGVYHGKAQYYYFSDIIPSSPNKFNLLAILYKPSSPNLIS